MYCPMKLAGDFPLSYKVKNLNTMKDEWKDGAQCEREKCAWWRVWMDYSESMDGKALGECAILSIAKMLERISEKDFYR